MKRFFVLILSALLLFSCAKPYECVQLESVTLKSITPTGLRTMDVLLQVTLDNSGQAFEVKNPLVTVKMTGTPLMTLTFDKLVFEKQTKTETDCLIHAELAQGQNVMSVMAILGKKVDPSLFTVDIQFNCGRPGTNGMKFEIKDRPVGKLLGKMI